jgi:hypothetical protein
MTWQTKKSYIHKMGNARIQNADHGKSGPMEDLLSGQARRQSSLKLRFSINAMNVDVSFRERNEAGGQVAPSA